MRFTSLICFVGLLCLQQAWAVGITVDAAAGHKPISPAMYGRNNVVDKEYASLMREAGVALLRENGGNNSTKYNWKDRLSSHPDWYNNVGSDNWDAKAVRIESEFPGVQGLFAFQLLGYVGATKTANFGDWAYNGSQGWSGVGQNLAGGGVVNTAGGDSALLYGGPGLYLKQWPADSTVGIIDHWFGAGGLGLDKKNFVYWNMDNEPEIWNGTHDDVVTSPMPAEEYMQKYFAVALAARAAYPEIKLVGPVFTNEWQWYKWQTNIEYDGRYHSWMEYFIRRIGEKQDSTGVRLLDVLDFHMYPGLSGTNPAEAQAIANMHRIWFDTTWEYPKANGLRTLNGAYDLSLEKEYVWKRCGDWMKEWLGPDHGVTFGLSECGNLNNTTAQQAANWYASHMGVFADSGVEIFSPWDWYPGQLEALNLFTKSAKTIRVTSASDADSLVSGYSSINNAGDSLTVILVNHSTTAQQSASVSLSNFPVTVVSAPTRTLSALSGETFTGAASNAMAVGMVPIAFNSFTVTLPPLAITAVILKTESPTTARAASIPAVAPFTMKQQGTVLHIDGYRGELLKGQILLLNGRAVKNFAVQTRAGAADVSLEGVRGACVVRFENGMSRKLIVGN